MLLAQLGHSELVPFIQNAIKLSAKYRFLYYLVNDDTFVQAGYLFKKGFHTSGFNVGSRFTYFCYGLVITFLLVPLHEYIHVLAYKSQGATNTSYAANLKKFYFMALTNKFVANKKEFEIVALAPFVSISSVLIIFLFFANAHWALTIVGTLLAHTAMRSEDFGLLNYFEFHKDKQIVTYDDVEHKISYFYGKSSDALAPA